MTQPRRKTRAAAGKTGVCATLCSGSSIRRRELPPSAICITLHYMNPTPPRDAQLVIRLPRADLGRIDKFADRLELTRSEAVRQLLRVGLAAAGRARSNTALLELLSAARPPGRR